MTACVRQGCTGTYRQDGSCGECGYKAPQTAGGHVVAPRRPAATSNAVPGSGPAVALRPPENPTAHHSVARRRTTTARTRLGAGLVEVPPIPERHPASAVLTSLQVPLTRRKCRKCHKLVGQPRGDEPGRSEGFCPHDGTPFSFSPTLEAGTIVQRRYEVRGCLAYGGLGWIYLAKDRHLGDRGAERWVVLKGLIDVDDPESVEAILNERRFLVEVDHPNIVKIHDFVQHPDPHTGTEVGYIVMEYLGGETLQRLYSEYVDEDGQRVPLPLSRVLAYGLEILEALGYLHDRNLVYCDLKPDNVMQVESRVKLIDLGAVVSLSGRPRAVFGTPGFQAPELQWEHDPADPSVASDLYTVGRTLALLSFEFAGFSGEYRYALPSKESAPLLNQEESFHRLLQRATHPDPACRFASAEEMREQVHGVLLEVLSRTDGQSRPTVSTQFTPERRAFGTGPGDAGILSGHGATGPEVDWPAVPQALPAPLVDPSDPAAGFLATLGTTEPDDLITALGTAPERTAEVLLRLVDARIAAGDLIGAEANLDEFLELEPTDWRGNWYRGLVALARSRPGPAGEAFDAVYDDLPGELASKLALAVAAEWIGDDDRAETLYDRVWRTDNRYVSSAFGLARIYRRRGRWNDAVAVLDGVPGTSSQHVAAQTAAIRALLGPKRFTEENLMAAAIRLKKLQLGIESTAVLSIEVLTATLNFVCHQPNANHARPATSRTFNEKKVRGDLEQAYRDLATLTKDQDMRSELVDRANQVRPHTVV